MSRSNAEGTLTRRAEVSDEIEASARRPSPERRRRFGLLLLAIVTAFAVQGVAEPGRWEQVIVSALLVTTLLLALWVAETKPRRMRIAIVIAGVLFAVSLINAVVGKTDGATARIANLLLVALAPGAIVVGIARTLRARNRVTIEAVFGVLCLYLLLGIFFAFVYGVIARVDGTFFAGGVPTTTARALYFSFTTLTTVGYGDYTASSNLGHTVSVTEALVGQIYLVTVVAVIVGNLGLSRRGAPPAQGEAQQR